MNIRRLVSLLLTVFLLAAALSVATPSATADTVPMTWKPYQKAYVTLVYDDNRADLPDIYDIIMGEYNMPFCAAVPSATLPRNLDTLRALEDHGGEILAHGHHHMVLTPSVSWSAVENEYRTSYEKLTEAGFNVNGTIKCGGNTDEENDINYLAEVEAYSSKYFKYADRSGTSTQYYNPRVWMQSRGFTGVQAEIDEAIENKEWLVLFAHSLEETPAKLLRAILDYLQEKEDAGQLEVVTYRDMYKNLANWQTPVNLGETKYTVDFYSTDNKTLLTSVVVTEGKTAATPQLDVASGVTFNGWSASVNKVTDNLRVYAKCTYSDGTHVETDDAVAVKLRPATTTTTTTTARPSSSTTTSTAITATTTSTQPSSAAQTTTTPPAADADTDRPTGEKDPTLWIAWVIGGAVILCAAGGVTAALILRKKRIPPTK